MVCMDVYEPVKVLGVIAVEDNEVEHERDCVNANPCFEQ